VIAGKAIVQGWGGVRVIIRLQLFALPAPDVFRDSGHLARGEARKARHTPRSLADDPGHGGNILLLLDSQQRWVLRRRPRKVVAVAVGAVLPVELPSGFLGLVLCQAGGPGHLVGVDVEKLRFGIKGAATPLRAAVETGEDDRLLPDPERDERGSSVK
jgi:hypothetical protein